MARVREPSDTQSQLQRIDTGVEIFQTRVRDVHEAHVRGPGHFARQKMYACGASRCEVNAGSSGRNLSVGK